MTDGKALATLGSNLKRIRGERNWTLEDLAEASGVSTGMLSQVERGGSNPSFKTLYRLANALGVPLGYFFLGVDRPDRVVRKSERMTLGRPPGVGVGKPRGRLVYQLLSPDLSGALELLWIEYGPGASTAKTPFVHQGEECGVVIKGRLEVHIGEETWLLEAGDSAYIQSATPHWFRNPDAKPAVMVWAVTPPSF